MRGNNLSWSSPEGWALFLSVHTTVRFSQAYLDIVIKGTSEMEHGTWQALGNLGKIAVCVCVFSLLLSLRLSGHYFSI